MWITISRDFERYFEQRVALTNRSTGKPREMVLVLYRAITDTFLAEGVAKKPVAVFYDAISQNEIPRPEWTAEMHVYAKEEIKKNPVRGVGTKWHVGGKILLAVLAIGVAIGSALLANAILIEHPRNTEAKTAFLQLPAAGDRYYGSLYGGDYRAGGQLRQCWVKVGEMSPQDSIGTIQLSQEISTHTFDTKSKDFENFEDGFIRVKFRIDRNKVVFRALDSDVAFESSVIDNRYDLYKIPYQR